LSASYTWRTLPTLRTSVHSLTIPIVSSVPVSCGARVTASGLCAVPKTAVLWLRTLVPNAYLLGLSPAPRKLHVRTRKEPGRANEICDWFRFPYGTVRYGTVRTARIRTVPNVPYVRSVLPSETPPSATRGDSNIFVNSARAAKKARRERRRSCDRYGVTQSGPPATAASRCDSTGPREHAGR